MILLNPVVLSVIVMTVLCLLKLNVLLALIVSALVAGVSAHMPVGDIMGNLINGMGGNAETKSANNTFSFNKHKTIITITERTTGFNKIINLPPTYF